MNTPPPIYVGPGTIELCAKAHAECAAAKQNKRTFKSIAEELGVSRATLHKLRTAHGSMRSYDVQLAREGSATMRVCTVVTPKGAPAAAVAAYREYAGSLKGLELPGWKLQAGDAAFTLEVVRAAASPNGDRPASQGPSFAKKYGSLTNATRRAA